VTALLYNYPVEEKFAVPMCESMEDAEAELAVGTPRIADLTIKGLPANAKVKVTTLDKDHGNAVAAWKAMGSPEPPSRDQVQALRKSAMALKEETLQADASGTLSIKRKIAPWSLVLVESE
jgi:xylan 1,4-beta-xylosidase